MRGEMVVVRAFGNEPLVRRVWKATPEAVFICDEENYQRLIAGKEGYWPVGFPKKDVFCYDATLVDKLIDNYESDLSLWDDLTPWSESCDRFPQIESSTHPHSGQSQGTCMGR